MSVPFHAPVILLVDHDEAEREALGLLLVAQGCKVYEAPSGLKGASMFVLRSKTIDLVIAARSMPVMGGLRLTELLHRYDPGVRVILTTRPGEVSPPAERDPLGICVVLALPCSESDLQAALAAAMDGAHCPC